MIDRLTGHTGNTTTEPANTLLKYSFISLNNIRQKLRYLYGIKHLEVKLPHKKEMWQEQPRYIGPTDPCIVAWLEQHPVHRRIVVRDLVGGRVRVQVRIMYNVTPRVTGSTRKTPLPHRVI